MIPRAPPPERPVRRQAQATPPVAAPISMVDNDLVVDADRTQAQWISRPPDRPRRERRASAVQVRNQ